MKNRWKRILTRAVVCALLVALLLPITALASFTAKVSASRTYLYSSQQARVSEYKGVIPKNTQVSVLTVAGSKCQVSYNGAKYWALYKDFKPVNLVPVYSTRTVWVYSTASSKSNKVDRLTADFPLYAVDKGKTYTLVQNMNGTAHGYVYTKYLSTNKPNKFALSDSARGTYSSSRSSTTMPSSVKSKQDYVAASMSKSKYIDYIIYAAQSRLGCKYSSSPNNNTTFSNGSFVKACFGHLEFSVSSNVQTIGHKGSAPYVAKRDLKRGDIVCFDADGNDDHIVDHVGIYLGNNYFIHQSYEAGMIIVSNMKSGFYEDAFCWGRRVVY